LYYQAVPFSSYCLTKTQDEELNSNKIGTLYRKIEQVKNKLSAMNKSSFQTIEVKNKLAESEDRLIRAIASKMLKKNRICNTQNYMLKDNKYSK